jgi:hypothetical protein
VDAARGERGPRRGFAALLATSGGWALARQGETIGDTERVDLRAVAEEAWGNVDTAGATLTVARTRSFDADRTRLVQLFENLDGTR